MKVVILFALLFSNIFAKNLNYNLEPIKITENSYYFYGKEEYFNTNNGANISNSAFIITSKSVIVIDTGSSYLYGKAMIDEIKKITNKPIKFIFNTHHHPDHFLGNNAFKDVDIYATEFTAKDIKDNGEFYIENLSNLSLDWINGTKTKAPNKTLTSKILTLDNYKIEVLFLQGHTEDDIALYDPQTKILYASDLVFFNRAAATPHSDIPKWINALNSLRKINYNYILPGHGKLSKTKEPIDQTISYLNYLDNLYTKSAKEGLSIFEILNLPKPVEFKDINMLEEEFERSTINLYPKYEKKAFK